MAFIVLCNPTDDASNTFSLIKYHTVHVFGFKNDSIFQG